MQKYLLTNDIKYEEDVVTNTLVELFEILLLQNLSFTAAFYASVLLLKINFAITLLKFASEPQTML